MPLQNLLVWSLELAGWRVLAGTRMGIMHREGEFVQPGVGVSLSLLFRAENPVCSSFFFMINIS